MSDDIRKLLEKFSVLSEQAATATDLRTRKAYVAPDYTDTTQPKLPLGKTGNEPGPDTFHRMAQTLSNQGAETAAQPAKPLPQPGQKTLPGFGITKIEPETPAYIPKQPWLDPKGSKEPAIMRKAAGNLPAQPLGVIGGTGPDDKFAKAAPPVANEPNIPKQAPKLAYSAPRIKVGTGNEYSNVYGNRREKDSPPSFADVQYAKDVQRELGKTPNDPNLKAELGLLQQRGIAPKPAAQPATQPDPEQSNPGSNPKPGALPPIGPTDPKKVEPTAVAYDTDAWMRQHGVVKEYADEFEHHINNLFNEQGIPGLIRRLFTKGKPKAPEAPPTVTPQKPVQMPKDVETPAYVRKAEKSATPEPTKPSQAANDPKMPPQKGDKTDIGAVVPGPKPIEPPKTEPAIPKPLPGKPGSATKQRRKLVPPVLPAEEPGGGKTTPEPVKPLPVDVDSDDSQLQVPNKVDVPTLPGPLPPNSPFVVTGPETSGSKTDKPDAPSAAEKPAERPPVKTEPLTKQQLDIINQNDREAAKAKAERERQKVEPVKPAEPGAGTAPAKPSPPAAGSGTGAGTGSGSGTGPGTGTKPANITPGYDPDAWMQQHGVVKESRAIRYLLKDFKKFVNKPRA